MLAFKKIPDEQLLAEVEDLLRNLPKRETIRHELDQNFEWFGRVSAVVDAWDSPKSIPLQMHLSQLRSLTEGRNSSAAFQGIMTILHQARTDLRLRTTGPTNVAISHKAVFTYFDEVRKILEVATTDLLIVDPYLDAEFISRYIPHVPATTPVRLLTQHKLSTLLPAVDLYKQQNPSSISVRSRSDLHDRYIFINHKECYQSGASLKDGAKNAPTSIVQITDAFAAMLQTYEDFWKSAKVER